MYLLYGFFPYDGYSESDRTGTAQDYHPILSTPPPHSPDVYPRLIVTTLLESADPGVWVRTPVPTDCSAGTMAAPLRQPPRQPSPSTHRRVS